MEGTNMANADWKRAVELMRADPAEMGVNPDNAARLVLRLGAAQLSYFGQLRRVLGVTMSELHALLSLWDGGRCSMSELADRVDLSRAAMTTLADRIERAGYIERIPDPTDRRRILLSVTPKWEKELFKAAAGLVQSAAESAAASPGWSTRSGDIAGIRTLLREDSSKLHAAAPKRPGDRAKSAVVEDDPTSYW